MSKKWLAVGAVLLVACLLLAASYNGRFEGSKLEKIEHVVRVFMHEPLHYSAMVQDQVTKDMFMRKINDDGFARDVRFKPDVADGQEMWVSLEYAHGMLEKITFHVHSAKDVDGAGWNHGKFGSGRTQVIN